MISHARKHKWKLFSLSVFLVFVLFFLNQTVLAGWTERTSAGQRSWASVASSSDGVKLVAVNSGGYIYTSTDNGATWTERTNSSQRAWTGVASSSDGTKLVAVVGGTTGNRYIYTSADSGATWTERTSPGSKNWTSVSSSSDGTKLVATPSANYIYTSADSGATWVARTGAGARTWRSVASSSDGTKLAAVAGGNYIWTSADSGVTWTSRTVAGLRTWKGIASSSDGTKLAAVVDGGNIWTSADSGVTWTERSSLGVQSWKGIASSSDGTKLAAVVGSGYIYISTDSGANWTEQTNLGVGGWTSVASSSNGTKLAAAQTIGYIYTFEEVSNITTLGDGTNGANSTIGPGGVATEIDRFSLATSAGTDTVTGMTVTLTPANTFNNIATVDVQTTAGVSKCSLAPTSNTVLLTSCAISVTTTPTDYKILITPKTHANMPIVPGASYATGATVTSITATNSVTGTDTSSATVTVDNASPNVVTGATATAGNTQVSLSWTNPNDADFLTGGTVLVLRRAGAVVNNSPVEGVSYNVGDLIINSTVACVLAGSPPATSCIDTGLTNGTTYYYQIFTKDSRGNYSDFYAGTVPTGSPATPANNASVNITPATDVLIDEGSTNTSAYSVVLGSAPSANVTITISETSPAVTLNTPSLIFTTANWNTPQSVSITGATDSDLVDSNDQLITFDISSSDLNYNILPDQTRQVDINDTTVASFSVTPATDFAITEGQSGLEAYNVVLGAQPATDVVINISENPASPAITLNTTSLTFTNSNWNSAQPVLVSAPEEANTNSEQDQPLRFSINSGASDTVFVNLLQTTFYDRNIDVTDNDTPGFTVTETGGVTSVIEEGSSDSFSVVLNSQPTGTVRLDLTSSDTTALTLSVPYVEFSTVDWNVAKNITASGINDADTDSETGSIDITINQTATADPNYDTVPSQSINFSVTDNDLPVEVVVFENKYPAINGGSVTQKKSGSLKVGGITSTAYVRFDGLLKIPLGASDGKVLTSDADGDASWQSLPTSSGTTTWGSIGTSNGPIMSSSQNDLINILNLKANLASPIFSGSPRSNETLNTSDNDNSVATTAFVISKVGTGSSASNGWTKSGNTVSLTTLADSFSVGEDSIFYKGADTNSNNRFLYNIGSGNLFLGLTSGSLNLTGSYNTGIGQESLSGLNSYTSGFKNTGFGYQTLSKGDSWFNNNTAFGSKALGGGSIYGGGVYNTAVGYEPLLNTYSTNGTTTGISNTGVGYQALKNNTTGSYNVAVGSGALINNTTGNYNIAIGYGAGSTTGNLHNTVAIGYGATVDQSNKIRLGNSSISVVEFQVIPSIVSDLRLKENINDIDLGLEFIKKLRPVSYTLKGGKGIDYGFIAQEVETAIGKDTNLVLTDNTEFRGKTMRYEGLIAPLVKAVLEQDAQLQNDKKDLEDFAKRLVELENKLR